MMPELVEGSGVDAASHFTGDWELLPRMALSALLIAPAGFFMGMPFPKGASRRPALVDWAFAVNGSASVIGSVLIVLVASSYGFSIGLGLALLVYLAAYVLYRRESVVKGESVLPLETTTKVFSGY